MKTTRPAPADATSPRSSVKGWRLRCVAAALLLVLGAGTWKALRTDDRNAVPDGGPGTARAERARSLPLAPVPTGASEQARDRQEWDTVRTDARQDDFPPDAQVIRREGVPDLKSLVLSYRRAVLSGDTAACELMWPDLKSRMKEIVDAIEQELSNEPDPSEKKELVYALVMLQSEESVEAMRRLIGSTTEGPFKDFMIDSMRYAVSPFLGETYLSLLLSPDDGRLVDPLEYALINMADEGVARRIVSSYEETGDDRKRELLSGILTCIRNDDAAPALVDAIEESSNQNSRPELVKAAAMGLANIGTDRSLGCLIDASLKIHDEETRRSILEAYENPHRGINAGYVEQEMVSHPDADIRIASLHALLNADREAAPQAIEKALHQEKDPRVRDALEEAKSSLEADSGGESK